jgi:hypothetical protein
MITRLLNAQPWRFKPGAIVFVRGWPANTTGKVTAHLYGRGLPHYLIVDDAGHEWRVAQVELSSKPIDAET